MDLIVERGSQTWAVEIKASKSVRTEELGGLRSFREYFGKKHRPCVLYLGETRKVINGIVILPWQEGIRGIFES